MYHGGRRSQSCSPARPASGNSNGPDNPFAQRARVDTASSTQSDQQRAKEQRGNPATWQDSYDPGRPATPRRGVISEQTVATIPDATRGRQMYSNQGVGQRYDPRALPPPAPGPLPTAGTAPPRPSSRAAVKHPSGLKHSPSPPPPPPPTVTSQSVPSHVRFTSSTYGGSDAGSSAGPAKRHGQRKPSSLSPGRRSKNNDRPPRRQSTSPSATLRPPSHGRRPSSASRHLGYLVDGAQRIWDEGVFHVAAELARSRSSSSTGRR